MPGVTMNESKTLLLDQRLANPPYDNLKLGLFTGSTDPTPATVIGDLTEVSGTGYGRQTVSGWSSAILLLDGHAYSAATPVTFANSGGTDWDEATGWFWWDEANSKLVMAARFPTSFTLGPAESKNVTPSALLTGE